MIKLMQDAIEALRELPEDRQAMIARAILDAALDDEDVC